MRTYLLSLPVLILLTSWCSLWSACAARDDEHDAVKAAITAHENNLKLFTNYKCRYTDRRGPADSLEKALAGDFRVSGKCDFSQIVSGDKEKYECHAPQPKPPKPEEMKKIGENLYATSHMYLPFVLLQRGSDYLQRADRITPPEPSVVVFDKQIPRSEDFPMPLSMGVSGPYQRLAPYALLHRTVNKVAISSKGETKLENQTVVHVGFKSTQWGELDFYFDPQRGYLPFMVSQRFISPDGKPYAESRTYLKEAKQCSNKGWYPLHFIEIGFPSKDKAPFSVIDVRVTELDTDTKVTDADLTLELPAGTVIRSPSRTYQGYRLQQAEKVTPDDIPKLQEKLSKTDRRVPPKQQ